MILVYDIHTFHQMTCVSKFVNNKKDIANINIDTSLKVFIKNDVAAKGFPVAVESNSDKFTVGIKNGATGISSGDIIIG